MILATVGTQLAFPRLMTALNGLAAVHGLRIVAQTAHDDEVYAHLECHKFLAPLEFDRLATQASVIVAHAGIGSILSAGRHGKAIILFPRMAQYGEHRNDHQLATVAALDGRKGLHVARDVVVLERLILASGLDAYHTQESPSRDALIGALQGYIGGLAG